MVAFLCSRTRRLHLGRGVAGGRRGYAWPLVTPTERAEQRRERCRPRAGARRPILGRAPRTGADRSPRRSATSATTTGSPTSARRAARCRRPGTVRPSTSSRRSTASDSTSRSARRWTCSRRSRRRRSRRSSSGPTGSTSPTTSSGPASLLGDIASIQRTDTPEHLDRYEQRLRAFPRYLEACAEIAREGIATGVVSPRTVVERAVAQVERIVAMSGRGCAAARRGGRGRRRGARTDRRRVDRRGRSRVRSIPRRAPRATSPTPRRSNAVTDLPGGEAIYAAEIRSWTTLASRSPGGARPRQRTMGCDPGGTVRGRRAARVRGPGRGDGGPEGVGEGHARRLRRHWSSSWRDQVQRSWDIAPQWFGRLPKANCRVREIEAYRAADMALAFYMPPTADGERPGTYYINTHDLARQGAAPDRGGHLPRGEPGPPFPDRPRDGVRRPSRAAAVRRAPGRRVVRRGLGALQRAARRRDGPLRRRLGAARDAGGARRIAPPA